jgi:hypothetical protein
VIHSRFEEVLFLDADSMPVVDPTFIFSSAEYLRHGAWFAPDRPGPLSREVWSAFGVDYRNEQTFESGQFVLNKRRCWEPLSLAMHYNEHSDYYYRLVHGDKDTFHLAWRRLGRDYAMIPGWTECRIHTFMQRWFDGRLLFQHRSGDKWRLDGGNKRSDFLYEDKAVELLERLRARWRGLWRNACPSSSEQNAIARLSNRLFVYERIGLERRDLELRADGAVGVGRKALEVRWSGYDVGGEFVLALCAEDRPTCLLKEEADSVWRGQWLERERCHIALSPR